MGTWAHGRMGTWPQQLRHIPKPPFHPHRQFPSLPLQYLMPPEPLLSAMTTAEPPMLPSAQASGLWLRNGRWSAEPAGDSVSRPLGFWASKRLGSTNRMNPSHGHMGIWSHGHMTPAIPAEHPRPLSQQANRPLSRNASEPKAIKPLANELRSRAADRPPSLQASKPIGKQAKKPESLLAAEHTALGLIAKDHGKYAYDTPLSLQSSNGRMPHGRLPTALRAKCQTGAGFRCGVHTL
jgi:hypothetical protein